MNDVTFACECFSFMLKADENTQMWNMVVSPVNAARLVGL